MFVRRIITGGTINSIIESVSNGKESNYLIVDNPRKELERLAYFANKKIETGFESYLKVKYEWELGQRARVLEIVTKKDEVVTIYKFVSMTNFDQHAIDLERMKENICEQGITTPDKLRICLVTTSSDQNERVNEMLADMGIECEVENI